MAGGKREAGVRPARSRHCNRRARFHERLTTRRCHSGRTPGKAGERGEDPGARKPALTPLVPRPPRVKEQWSIPCLVSASFRDSLVSLAVLSLAVLGRAPPSGALSGSARTVEGTPAPTGRPDRSTVRRASAPSSPVPRDATRVDLPGARGIPCHAPRTGPGAGARGTGAPSGRRRRASTSSCLRRRSASTSWSRPRGARRRSRRSA